MPIRGTKEDENYRNMEEIQNNKRDNGSDDRNKRGKTYSPLIK